MGDDANVLWALKSYTNNLISMTVTHCDLEQIDILDMALSIH